jgi:hypothetical protein
LDNVILPGTDLLEAYDAYQLYTKGWYRTFWYGNPIPLLEGSIAAFHQIYKDTWYEDLSNVQIARRATTILIETELLNIAASLAGTSGAGIGASVGSLAPFLAPVGAGVGYYFGASFVTKAGERWFRSQANPWLFDKFELGVYP